MSVTVYGSDMCGACQKTEEFLEEQGVEFEHKDILKNEKDAEDMADTIKKCDELDSCEFTPEKRPSIPLVVTEDKVIVGFDKSEMSSISGISEA